MKKDGSLEKCYNPLTHAHRVIHGTINEAFLHCRRLSYIVATLAGSSAGTSKLEGRDGEMSDVKEELAPDESPIAPDESPIGNKFKVF